ncbi:hypothetical protein CH299_29020 [Rhodococcus sp. 14-2686-1-2]|nr:MULTISPECIES: hypothetical protein [unclassified Rhodococcus (in: high G+C Gram-positive bacteria)]OZE92951.1 hypothetical protein CH301_28505 [Rhodococcus sp. 15-1189-1-1a]OZF08205.1 hypothetical protein CH299_29020 [Rhodococcus sp. 14-2686-1-2]
MSTEPARSAGTDAACPPHRSSAPGDGRTEPRGISVDTAQARLIATEAPIPCREDPAGWDVDRTGATGLRAAVRACRLDCPLLSECRIVADSGTVVRRSMVWAGIVYDEKGDRLDLSDPRARVGGWTQHRDTRLPDAAGRIFNGHTGRWEAPTGT